MKALQQLLASILAAAIYASVSSPVRAEITVTKSEYRAGVLVVRGETSQSSQRVTLDGRFDEWTNKFNEFTFRVRYLPRDCLVTLRAGREMGHLELQTAMWRDRSRQSRTRQRKSDGWLSGVAGDMASRLAPIDRDRAADARDVALLGATR
jgi:hypothetical protein